MSSFTISNLQDASILALNDMRDVIQIEPSYQRVGGVWSDSKKQLFIDSLLNKYDVPKFYFHILTGSYAHQTYQYAIIDGRQRLEAIWEFVNGDFPLADDFVFLEDPAIKVASLTFKELAKEYPRLVTRFNSRSLSVMIVAADDIDAIEDMFSRLNEAVPLNAAEKRNAKGGVLPLITRDIAQGVFFSDRVALSNTRYRHIDLATKLLYLAFKWLETGEFADTKKASLDNFFRVNKDTDAKEFQASLDAVNETLNNMASTFIKRDSLLRSSGVVPVYFIFFFNLFLEGKAAPGRKEFVDFEALRAANRKKFESEDKNADFKLIEYDELAQSSNDAAAIRYRYDILRTYLKV